MNTGWESARSLNAAVADKIFLNTSPVVSFLLIAFRTSPKSCNPTGLETPKRNQWIRVLKSKAISNVPCCC